jgi:hypothetical protein
MITEKIKALFNFIEFLHSNIDNFKQYETIINDVYDLKAKRNVLKPQNNFKDKIEYDELQKELIIKFDIIVNNITKPVESKVNELKICDWNRTESLWNNNIEEISNLKRDFDNDDVAEIFEFKNKYFEFRTKTACDYFQTFFFSDLDEVFKELFDFFKETTENEFDNFETKPLEVNDLFEAITLFKDGHNAFEIPNFILNKPKEQPKISYIKEAVKDQIFNELVFNKGLYYFSDIHKDYIEKRYRDLENNFETKIDFEKAVNSLLHSNGLHFYSKLRTLKKESEFINYIESQYNLYNEYTPNNSLNWLNFTKKAIMYGFGILSINSDTLKASFMNWYNDAISKIESKEKPKTDYWEQDINNELLITEFEKAIVKLVENIENEKDLGCLPMRFRMLPNVILKEDRYNISDKKYLLKRMFFVLERNKSNDIIKELIAEFRLIVEPYFEIYDFIIKEPQQNTTDKPNKGKRKKIAEKWYALLYWIELSANGQQPPKSIEGTFVKSEIEKIGREKTGTTGQSFYREFIKIDLNNERLISKAFSKEWKNEIIRLSNNSLLISNYIQDKYNSK